MYRHYWIVDLLRIDSSNCKIRITNLYLGIIFLRSRITTFPDA